MTFMEHTVKNNRGRGSIANPTGRFESIVLEENIDTAWIEGYEDHLNNPIRTEYFVDHSQSIITTNDSPDVGFNKSVNPYRGCEHGCAYCYARPSHEYLGLSAGLDFETKIFAKINAPDLLRQALYHPSWQPELLAMSGITDCYQPVERQLKITRGCLEVLAEFRNPVGLITKNALITRDIDVLKQLAQYQCVGVLLSVTTLDDDLHRVMEPRTSSPKRRLEAIRQLSQAGIPVGVMMGPIIPGLTDHEMAPILKAAAEAGATSAHYTMLRLPYGLKDLFSQWLDTHAPLRKERVLSHLRAMRGEQLNNSEFGLRMRGKGVYADYIAHTFKTLKQKFGLNVDFQALSTAHFQRPVDDLHPKQLGLFQPQSFPT